MKPTTSRTGLHKVRVGDRVVVACSYDSRTSEAIISKMGRKLAHGVGYSFDVASGREVDGGWTGWHPDDYEAHLRCNHKKAVVRERVAYGKDLTESQLDRILAILEEVQT